MLSRSLLAPPILGDLAKQLGSAQAAKDEPAVKAVVQSIRTELGEKAGEPEVPTEFVLPDEEARGVSPDQVPELFQRALDYIKANAWWKSVKSGADCQAPLRAVASVVDGCLAARAAGCAHPEELLAEAHAAADFLLAAQRTAGRDCFPFPGWRGKRGKLGAMAERFLSKAEAAGKVAAVMQDGWIFDDLGTGELYFDTGLAGVALLHLYETTREEKYLKGARQAADWALARPAVANWNYNSFLVQLLAEMHRVTGEEKYLASAKEKARLGILPGQLLTGPHAGRWLDPHNARLVYHFILLRGLICLLAELPPADPDRALIEQALAAGLKAHDQEIATEGGTHPDTTLEVYCRLLADRAQLGNLISPATEAAAKMIQRAAVEEFKNDHPTVSPGTWGRYLQLTAGK
jgi:hypothetical protein